MMPLYQLIIAHLLGDFVFQSNSLIKWKHESWKGTFVHSLIITAFSGLLIFPYLTSVNAFLILFLLFTAHFLQDILKIVYQQRSSAKSSIWPFFIDQFFHFYFIYLFGSQLAKLGHMQLEETFSQIYFSENLMLFVSLALFCTFAVDIVIFENYRIKNKTAKYRRDYCGIVRRLICFTVVYALFTMGK